MNLDQSPIFTINALHLMTPSEIRVLTALQSWIRKVDYGKHKSSFPSRSTLACDARTSVKTVERFIKRFSGVLFEYIPGKHSGNSNTYKLFDGCFDAVEFFRAKGYIFNFKKHKKMIQKLYQTDADFYVHRDRHLSMLSTMKCRTLPPSKCRTTKDSSSKSSSYKEHIQERTLQNVPKSQIEAKKEPLKFGKGFMFLREVGVSEREATKIAPFFADVDLLEAKKDLWWFSKTQRINNPAALMISRAKEHAKKRLSK